MKTFITALLSALLLSAYVSGCKASSGGEDATEATQQGFPRLVDPDSTFPEDDNEDTLDSDGDGIADAEAATEEPVDF